MAADPISKRFAVSWLDLEAVFGLALLALLGMAFAGFLLALIFTL